MSSFFLYMKRGEINSVQDVWDKTDGGRLIYEELLGNVPFSLIHSPLRNDDKTPSFGVFFKDGKYLFKDFGGESGDAIKFLMLYKDISFKSALELIRKNKYEADKLPYIPVRQRKLIDYHIVLFEQKHKTYFDKYQLDERFLNKNNVYAIDKFAIEKKIFPIPKDVAAFVYVYNNYCKILQIGDNVERKWINSVPNDTLWYLEEKTYNKLWVVKSVKDALVLKKHFGFDVVAVQNESAASLNRNMPLLLEKAKEIIICFGADPQGVESCKTVQQKWNTKYFNTYKYMLQYGVEDPSDVVAEFGVEVLEKMLKNKGFL